MKKICANGFRISNADQKALDHFLVDNPNQWTRNALDGMKNKAIKTILRDYLETYKANQTGNVTSDLSILIPAIVSMSEFKPYNYQTPQSFDKIEKGDLDYIQGDEELNLEIWANGFDLEDYELLALNAYYEDPEAQLEWFMSNKLYRRKNAFVKEHEKEMIKKKESYPARHDAFINHITSNPTYKSRKTHEAIKSFNERVLTEYKRTDKFMVDGYLTTEETILAEAYRSALLAVSEVTETNQMIFPLVPEFLREKNYV